MRYFIVSLLVMVFLPLGVAQALEYKQLAKTEKRHTCVYKYLDCRDRCDYHQNKSEVRPCKANCNRKYSCRPKKVGTSKVKQGPFSSSE